MLLWCPSCRRGPCGQVEQWAFRSTRGPNLDVCLPEYERRHGVPFARTPVCRTSRDRGRRQQSHAPPRSPRRRPAAMRGPRSSRRPAPQARRRRRLRDERRGLRRFGATAKQASRALDLDENGLGSRACRSGMGLRTAMLGFLSGARVSEFLRARVKRRYSATARRFGRTRARARASLENAEC